jgi:CHASE2 domain-containing sensor protein
MKIKTPFNLLYFFLTPKQFPPFKKYVVNFVIATVTVVGLSFAEDLMFFKNSADIALDSVMYWHSDFTPRLANGDKMQRMALIDIDQQTYRAWGSPVLTPRDKLKDLIEAAVKGGASVIAVDIQLSWWSDGCIHEDGKSHACSPSDTRADDELASYLKSINEREDDGAPLVILTRAYHSPSETGVLDDQDFLVRPPSFLDKVLIEEKNVFWSSTFFKIDSDEIRRRWQLASLVCQDGHLTVVPSMQLLVALGQLYDNAATVIREFKQKLSNWASQLSCDVSAGTTISKLCQVQSCPDLSIILPPKTGVSDDEHVIDLASGRETERVVYRFAPYDDSDSERRELIDTESALTILAEGADVVNQIVFIGNTHQDSGDFHPIPIRDNYVSGVYILANAVDTILRFGQFEVQAGLYKFWVSLFVIVIATVCFAWFGIVRAFFFCTTIVFVLLLYLSEHALHHGTGVDIALPLLAIQVIQTIRYLIESSIAYLKDRSK